MLSIIFTGLALVVTLIEGSCRQVLRSIPARWSNTLQIVQGERFDDIRVRRAKALPTQNCVQLARQSYDALGGLTVSRGRTVRFGAREGRRPDASGDGDRRGHSCRAAF